MAVRTVSCLLAALALGGLSPTLAYTPGSGTVYTDDFEGQLDPDWEQGNGFGQPSPWTLVTDGADRSFYADGIGPFGSAETRHWARHFVHPVAATTFSVAFEYRTERGNGYVFDAEIEQRAPVARKYRLRVDAGGALSLWRTVSGTPAQMAATGTNTIPQNQKRWLRLAVEPDPSGHPRVRARSWSGGAAAEPTTWTLEFLDTNDTIARVHRFELTADGPRGIETWIDDLDAYGDTGSGVASSVQTIHIMEMAHLDIGFTEPPDEIEAFAKSHLDQVLANLAADPDYRWTIEEGWWLDRWWERSTASQRAEMVSRLQEGRIKLTAGYASLHTTTAGHEELTRNLYWGSRFAAEHQVPLRTWITDDVPGSTFALPELLARSGIEYFVGGMNTPFGGRIDEPNHGDRPFWWVGPDGSRVLSWTTFDAYAEAFDYGFSFFDALPDLHRKLGRKLPELEEVGYPWPGLLLMRGFDNHYQGFHVRNLVDQWNATYDTPVFVLSTAEEFLDHMLATYGPGAFPSYSGDYGAAWSGSHAGAPHTEAWVRQAHRDGRAAEALLGAASAVDGLPVDRAAVDLMYRRMLEVDEHSGGGGWPGYFTPEEMDRNNRAHLGYARDARDQASALLDEGLDRVVAELSIAGDAVVAINPLGRARDGWVRAVLPPELYGSTFRVVERGTNLEVPFQRLAATSEILFRAADVPPVGYRVYDLVPGTPTAVPAGMLEVTGTSIENDFYRLVLDPADGSLSSLYDKQRAVELVDAGSTYGFNALASNVKSQIDTSSPPVANLPTSATVTIDSSGPMLGALRVTRTGTPHVETIYRLGRGEDRVEWENVLDRTLMPYVPQSLAVRAYTVTLPFDLHGLEIRSETTTRFLDPIRDGFPRPNVFDWHNVEHTLALWDGSAGVLYAVDATDAHHLETFSTLASATWSKDHGLVLSRLVDRSDEYEFEGGTVGPYVMEPDTSPLHRFVHHVRATGPSFDPAAASRFGFEALTPLRSRLLSHRPGNLPLDAASFVRVDAPGVLLYTVKNADDRDGLILRMTELTGTATTARVDSDALALATPERVQQDEEGGTPLTVDGDGFLVPLGPYETATVRVRAAPDWQPIQLLLGKDTASGTVRLEWTGGRTPHTVRRAGDPTFATSASTIADEIPASSWDDPVLADGQTWYYLVDCCGAAHCSFWRCCSPPPRRSVTAPRAGSTCTSSPSPHAPGRSCASRSTPPSACGRCASAWPAASPCSASSAAPSVTWW